MRTFWHILRKRKMRIVGVVLLLMFVFMAIFGPIIYPHQPAIHPNEIYLPPSWHHLLGTDYAGRNILPQIVLGARNVLFVAALAALFTVGIGTLIGLAAGYLGPIVDSILMRFTDMVLTIPSIVLILILAITIGMSNDVIMAGILSFAGWGGMARAIRSMVLSIRERSFVEVSQGLGMSRTYVIVKEILPNLLPYIVVHLMLALTGAVYGEVGLFFLGVVPFKADNWGVMLNFATGGSGAMYSTRSLMFLISPILAIVLLQTGIVLCTDVVNELVDPRLRNTVGGYQANGRRRQRRTSVGRISVGGRVRSSSN
ncbi:MAG: ABC transporter permease [Firmicutes bacterium]|nr:ABC transporter permease [Bacillota bacterium]